MCEIKNRYAVTLTLAEKSELVADRNKRHRSRVLPAIWGAWLVAAIFGDEIVGVAVFGLESDALLMSLTQRWWWVYQGLLLALAGLIVFVAKGICSIGANRA